MLNLFGAVGLSESDRIFNGTIGQEVVYGITQEFIDAYNADLAAATEIFVGGQTDKNKYRYRLAGGGTLQRRGRNALPGVVKAGGSWDVGFPLIDFGAGLASDDVTSSYMTAQEYELHLKTITNADANTYRFELLRALFNNTSWTFNDEALSDCTVYPLANGDATLYPPVLGASAEATANLYGTLGTTTIADATNPIKQIVAALQSRFGTPTGGSNIAVFINSAEAPAVQALTDFVKVQYMHVVAGDNTPIVAGIPEILLRSSWEVIGTCSGAIICKWAHIPAGYMLGVHLDAPAPLVERVDPADTKLGSGLRLVYKNADAIFDTAYWRHRYGLGVGNRLNGYAIQITASGTYTVPTLYA